MSGRFSVRCGAWGMGIAAALLLACGGGAGAKSPDKQSQAEYDIARDLFHKGDPRGALDHARMAVAADPDNAKALYFVSVIYAFFCDLDQGLSGPDCKIDLAEQFARRAVKADDGLRDAKNLLGQVLILRGEYQEAAKALEPLTKDPAYASSHLAWGNYGWALVLGGQIEPGLVALQNSTVEPQFCVGHYRLGVAYEKKGDLQRAEAELSRAIGIERPECQALQDAWEARGNVRQQLGRRSEAASDYARCVELSLHSKTGQRCLVKGRGLADE